MHDLKFVLLVGAERTMAKAETLCACCEFTQLEYHIIIGIVHCCQTSAFHQGEISQLNLLHLEGHLSSRFLVSACTHRRFVRAFNVQKGDESMCMFHGILWARKHVKLVGGFNFESTFGTLMRVQVVVCRKVSTFGFFFIAAALTIHFGL